MSCMFPKTFSLPEGHDGQYYFDNLPSDWEDNNKYSGAIPMPKEVKENMEVLTKKHEGHWPVAECKQAIEKAGYTLLMEIGAYYGNLLHNLQLTITEKIQTAGVYVDTTENVVCLLVNPNFFMIVRETDRLGILYHELQHIIYLHIYRTDTQSEHKKWNVAQDIAINGPLVKVRPSLMTLPDWSWGSNGNGKGTGEGDTQSGDDHSQWGKDGGTELERTILERALKRAAEQTKAGAVPQQVEESLQKLDSKKPRRWHKELRQFYRATVEGIDVMRTWARPNRRYGLWEAGSKTGMGKKLVIGIDTSGSMSAEDIQKILGECHAMLKCGVSATVYFFDTTIHHKVKLSRNTEVSICGRGGTSFKEFLQVAMVQRPDAIICCTDGDDCDNLTKDVVKDVPTLWMLIAGDRNSGTVCNFGRKILVDK